MSSGRKSSLNWSKREKTWERSWMTTPEVTPNLRISWSLPVSRPSAGSQSSLARPVLVPQCCVSPYLYVFGNGWWENLRRQRLFRNCHTRKVSPPCGDAHGRWVCWPEQTADHTDHRRRASRRYASCERTQASVISWQKGKQHPRLSNFPQLVLYPQSSLC